MGNKCCGRKKKMSKIILLLVGLDNAGKTVTARNLSGDSVEDAIAPTVGFSLVKLKYSKYIVHIFDLGGGSNIRSIWDTYFVDAHGIIFVIDSTDLDRLNEVQSILTDMLAHEKVRRKPLLVLANKQDDDSALDEIDLVERIQLEALVNAAEMPTLVETCCAKEVSDRGHVDRGIWSGYNWLVGYIVKNYVALNERVETDMRQQLETEHKERIAKVERMYANRSKLDSTHDVIELYSNYKENHINGLVRSISHEESVNGTTGNISNSSDLFVNQSDYQSEPQTCPRPQPITNVKPRPKSATMLIKQQLQLDNLQRRKNRRNILNRNKTSPASFYGTAQSARERIKPSLMQGGEVVPSAMNRSLKSAGDSVLNRPDTSREQINRIDGDLGGGGDDLGRLFHTNVFIRPQSASPRVIVDISIKHTNADESMEGSNTACVNIPGALKVLEVE